MFCNFKGSLLVLTDARTCAQGTGVDDVWAGVAMEEKNANDGATTIGCWTNGIFEVTASGAIVLGAAVTGVATGTTHAVKQSAATAASGAYTIGYALETASDNEVINVRLRL